MKAPRVDIRRLLQILLLTVVLPLTLAVLVDLAIGTWPLLTIVFAAIILPAGTFFMNRAALDEMNKVIEAVAPLEESPMPEESVFNDSIDRDLADSSST